MAEKRAAWKVETMAASMATSMVDMRVAKMDMKKAAE